MSGALVNLVAKGAQDAFLTGKPEVSFFNSMYKRYTNFAQFPVELFPVGTAGLAAQLVECRQIETLLIRSAMMQLPAQ